VMCRQDPERHPPGSDHATNAPLTRAVRTPTVPLRRPPAASPVVHFLQSSADIHIGAQS